MTAAQTCAVCHREVRWGTRGGRLAWWHRDDKPVGSGYVDKRDEHEPVLGTPSWEAPIIALDDVATTKDGEEDDRVFEIPPPEVLARPIDVDETELMPGGAKNLINAVRRAGGEATATYSRGPRVHASHGNLLGISDYVMVKFRRDGRYAVARWERAAKWALDTAYIVYYRDDLIYPQPATAADIRSWLLKWQGPLREDDS